jgi:2-isopropylmalate synthase
MDRIRAMYERCTKMRVPERQPYAGDLVFTAFSGSHQDAINKGFNYMEKAGTGLWEVPYLPIDPTDLGRAYEPVRINSQSGKGGAAFIMNHKFGFDMPKAMHPEFGDIVQAESDRTGKELKSDVIFELFKTHYLDINGPYRLVKHSFHEETVGGESQVTFTGTIEIDDTRFVVVGEGNGPIDAFFNAIHGQKMDKYTFIDYKEHAISNGSDSMAVAYVQLRRQDGSDIFGVGMSHNINLAPLRAILCAINRDKQMKRNQEG